jgi:hypothetical protein
MANKNTLRNRRAGVAGYGEKRGVAINTSSNPDRKSSKKTFKIKESPVQVSNEPEVQGKLKTDA